MYTIHSSSLGSSTKTYKTIQQAMAVARWFSTRDGKRVGTLTILQEPDCACAFDQVHDNPECTFNCAYDAMLDGTCSHENGMTYA